MKGTAIRVTAVVGGLATQKQERQLASHPDIVVATPGRFMELVENGEAYLSHLERLQVSACIVVAALAARRSVCKSRLACDGVP